MDVTPALTRFLVQTPFFGGLTEEGLSRIVEMLEVKTFAAGATVFSEGDSGRSMFIVGEGDLVVCRNVRSGRLVKITHYYRGSFFGETTLIAQLPRTNTVIVESDRATLYELTSRHLANLYQSDIETYVFVLQNINRELCRRLHKGESHIASVADSLNDDETQIRNSLPFFEEE